MIENPIIHPIKFCHNLLTSITTIYLGFISGVAMDCAGCAMHKGPQPPRGPHGPQTVAGLNITEPDWPMC